MMPLLELRFSPPLYIHHACRPICQKLHTDWSTAGIPSFISITGSILEDVSVMAALGSASMMIAVADE